ncbi:histidine phosphatase family protein [Lutimaribacter sp. EGI FJ00015]|uniref:Histidine phosphatase family protein n=1 Tax=Lutimaribacter degradans TaxID=2945989 RepID=A0ACC6A195_9RHOB|nr:histidine phosphatase family protein [Lutimaribacter sp. EGI FJ00013]MCM2563514.1 histidine phosphatase family protein [Lutimaribacter sp. EGI FJ00013]MCO0614694.1 histidine phosphatase family protein [Lutimaribacter sp. EGI FJ00015]MCO0637364.1 histidine phosphatase family protein [Lutimaribacter sp. EGI FJ00014]
MSRFFWVRHGPTHAKSMVGWSDLAADLSDTAALTRLNRALPSDALVISSDLVRATATADAISGTRPRLPHDPDLREMHFGAWELQRFDEVEDQTLIRAFWERPGDIRPPGGESWHDLSARVDRAVARLLAAHPGRDIVAVAHFGVILTQLQQGLKVGAYEVFGHKIDNLSVTELTRQDAGWQVGRINHSP